MGDLGKKGILPKYPLEMDLVPYPPKYKPATFQSYMGKSFAYQYIVHFKSQPGGMPDIDAFKIRSLIGTMRWTSFDWYKQFPENSLTLWAILEEKFLPHFQEEDQSVSLNSLTQSKQRENKFVQGYINRWRALAYRCKEPISQKSAVDMCKSNLRPKIKQMVISVKTKSMCKLLKAAIDAEDCHKELD